MTTERELSAEVRPAKLVDADPSSSSSNLDSTDSTGGGGKMAVSLATMEKGDLLPPHLKRQRVFQDFWFILGGVSAGLFNALNGLVPTYLKDFYGVGPNLVAVAAGVLRVATLIRLPVAVVSDRYDVFGFGYRRPWIFAGFLLGAVFYAVLAAIEAGNFTFGGFVVALFLANVAAEIWDNTLDGYTVDVTPKWRVGYVQGTLLNGGRGFGLVFGTLVFSQIADAGSMGWVIVFSICALASFLPLPAVFVLPEPRDRSTFQFSAAIEEFKRREIAAHAAYAFWSGVLGNIKTTIVPQYFIVIGSNTATYGLFATASGVSFMLGALFFGWLMDKYRHRIVEIFYTIMLLNWLASFLYIIIVSTNDPLSNINLFWLYYIMGGASFGATIATNMALVMLEIRDEGVAASFYAVFAVMTILGLAVGGFLSGPLITGLGYLGTGVFVTIGVIPNFPLIYLIFKGTNYAKMATEVTDVQLDNLDDSQEKSADNISSNETSSQSQSQSAQKETQHFGDNEESLCSTSERGSEADSV